MISTVCGYDLAFSHSIVVTVELYIEGVYRPPFRVTSAGEYWYSRGKLEQGLGLERAGRHGGDPLQGLEDLPHQVRAFRYERRRGGHGRGGGPPWVVCRMQGCVLLLLLLLLGGRGWLRLGTSEGLLGEGCLLRRG
jgi:hypothetical protein